MSEVQSKDELFEFNQYLSFLDLEHHPDFKEAWSGQNKVAFEKVLMSMVLTWPMVTRLQIAFTEAGSVSV